MNLQKLLRDPFRFFFPLGWLAGVLGVGLWLPLVLEEYSIYPVKVHQFVMIGGFLLTFVTGFLTTAIPRFTSTWYLRAWEFVLLGMSQLAAIVCALLAIETVHYIFVFMTVIVLINFVTRRFLKRKENPPFTFIFVGAGLLLWGTASFSLILHQFQFLPNTFFAPVRSIYLHGALLSLVIGVGGRLIPGILGWENLVGDQRFLYENAESYQEAVPGTLWLALFVFLVSYVLEGQIDSQFVGLLRAGVLFYVAIRYWRLHHTPKDPKAFTWGIWGSCWSFVLGMLMPVIWPAGGIHGIHMIFIGGFSLLTILVATRVTLAHGTRGKQLESSSLILKVLIGLFILSTFTRVTAIIWPRTYHSHLGYAALLWIIGIVLWGFLLIPRMISNFDISRKEGF